MAISKNQLDQIKAVFHNFIHNNDFNKLEDHIQAHYTLKVINAIGWNASNTVINTPQEIKTGNRPDILLKGSGGGTIFVVESKAPKESLNGKSANKTYAEQTCNYISSEGVSWGVLTNFIEWRIYNPHAYSLNKTVYKTLRVIDTEKKTVCASDEQLTEFFNLIESVFLNANRGKISKDSIYYPKQDEIKIEFFQQLKVWRQKLRTYLYRKYRDELTASEIDYQTQRILDRLIFIEFCFDKEIISQDYLGAVLFSKHDYYNELKRKFRALDEQFNSEIFSKDKCDNFDIPNTAIEEIIKGISRIDFSLLSVNIIGEVYEGYLGELLDTTSKNLTTDDTREKQKRKSQGIFYTPDYIVKHIVNNTLGELLRKAKNEAEIEAIKVIDPACGSGSFLIGAFDAFYEAYKRVRRKSDGLFWELSTRKKILLHNLFGVDLDEKAVEIAKLNLLLKGLEGLQETNVTGRKILPNLSLNIRCGNSLISGVFTKDSDPGDDIAELLKLKEVFYKTEDNEAKDKIIHAVHKHEQKINKYVNSALTKHFDNVDEIKPFNYEIAFCEVMQQGGFNCVIGNPPYIRLQGLQEHQPEAVNYFKDHYAAAQTGNYDIYVLFDEKAYNILKPKGSLGFIQPHKFLQADFGYGIRSFLSEQKCVKEIVHFGAEQVFKDASTYSCILFLHKKSNKNILVKEVSDLVNFSLTYLHDNEFSLAHPKNGEKWHLMPPAKQAIFEKLNKLPKTLQDITRKIFVGLQTSADKIYVLKVRSWQKDSAICYSNSLREEVEIEQGLIKPFLMGKDVKRYKRLQFSNAVIFPYHIVNGKPELMTASYIKEHFPNGWKYLNRNRATLEARENGKMTGSKFYAYIYPKNLAEFDSVKICTPDIANEPQFTIDTKGNLYHTTTVYSIDFNKNIKEDRRYFLGILNSELMWYFLSNTGNVLRGNFFRFKTAYLNPFPIKLINFKDEIEEKLHAKIVRLVTELMQYNENSVANQIKIEATEDEINDCVYKLYGITKEERQIIRRKNKVFSENAIET